MSDNPSISRITIYPVKSLDGVSLQKAKISNGGCLMHDRKYAMTDPVGRFIIGKTNPLVHTLRSRIDFESETIFLRHHQDTEWNEFHLERELDALEAYLSDYFDMPIRFRKNTRGRFLDIPDVSGVTVVSEASLQAISGWYENLTPEETRRRFRTTIELDGVTAFWEDHLFSTEGTGIEFRIGEVTMYGMSPRARCVVPTRNAETGEVTPAFPKVFSRNRAATLPDWSLLGTYGHHFFLTVNCYIPDTEIGKFIQVGDRVSIIGEKKFNSNHNP